MLNDLIDEARDLCRDALDWMSDAYWRVVDALGLGGK